MNHDDPKFSIAQAVAALKNGKTIGFPTETVYGLAANALDPEAVAHIFRIKARPFFDPLIVHIHRWEDVDRFTTSVPCAAKKLADKFWPGPLTLVLPKSDLIPDLVTSGLPFVALRIPAHPLALEVLRAFNGPLAAPSANRFGRISPTTADAVRNELGEQVEVVLDGGPCQIGLESTIIHFGLSHPTLLRPGGIPQEHIESLIGPLELPTPAPGTHPPAPGMLMQHYAPGTPLKLVSEAQLAEYSTAGKSTAGLLTWGRTEDTKFAAMRNLSPNKSLIEAAANLFQFLRELDALGLREIICLPPPNVDLGRAINDRLFRASTSKDGNA